MRFGLRELLFFLVLAAVPLGSYFMAFQPFSKQRAQVLKEITVKEEKLSQLEAATMRVPDLGNEIDKLKATILDFEQKLPAEREVEVILKQIAELASKHALTIKSIRTDKPVSAAQYWDQPIKVVIVGNFDGYYSFLLDLQQLKRVTRLPEMKVKKAPPEEGQMQAEMTLSIFFEKNANPTGKDRT
jgi:type IV pilus assembly protein PilO